MTGYSEKYTCCEHWCGPQIPQTLVYGNATRIRTWIYRYETVAGIKTWCTSEHACMTILEYRLLEVWLSKLPFGIGLHQHVHHDSLLRCRCTVVHLLNVGREIFELLLEVVILVPVAGGISVISDAG